MNKIAKRRGVLSLMALMLLLGGCTYESGPKQFALETAAAAKPADQGKVEQTASGRAMLEAAIQKAKTDPKSQKFWYKGHVKNTLLSRTTTSMFEGAVVKPDGYNVDARIARQTYQYYQIDGKRYVRVGDAWITAQEDPLPFDVMHGFEDILPLMDRAEQVKVGDNKIYGVECIPFQIKMNVTEWLSMSKSELFEPLRQQLAGRPDMQKILDNSTVKMTVWVGKEDQRFYQYETWIILPFPDGGYMDQQILFSFYKYNDPGIKIKDPEEVEKYLLY
ncbi:hypothetical protein [Brevibacillus migulae]|uniref:hypothetical protein n=1 Tax=Brevibacillus migulae TaxID=1644114 RepID=UPI00106E2F5A|nr:hypothetical protein [Brevibacillus migulae]